MNNDNKTIQQGIRKHQLNHGKETDDGYYRLMLDGRVIIDDCSHPEFADADAASDFLDEYCGFISDDDLPVIEMACRLEFDITNY